MSLISSDTLFHFTRYRENLIGILTHEFKPRLSVESFEYVTHYLPPNDFMKHCGIPMVCFCDIPLSQVGLHMRRYGRYGIGLKKAWGIKKGVSPVMYVHEHAPGPIGVAKLISLMALMSQFGVPEDVANIALQPGRLAYYLKPYEGELIRNGEAPSAVRFYDEREWRYIPAETESIPPISPQDLADPVISRPVRELVDKLPRLGFDPWDINYIVVESDSEVLQMSDAIDTIKEAYDLDAKRLLKTKIISAERIAADF
jgi:hypothetical protein